MIEGAYQFESTAKRVHVRRRIETRSTSGVLCFAWLLAACHGDKMSSPRNEDPTVVADAQPGLVTVADAAIRMANLVQRTAITGGRIVHVTSGMSASTPTSSGALEAVAKDLRAALTNTLEARGFVVSRNLAPPVAGGGDFAPTLQPEKLDPLPSWVVYFALSDAASGAINVTFWTLKYEDYAKNGVFKGAGVKETLTVTR